MLGMPTIHLAFENAIQEILTRAKKGVVAVFVRDVKNQGIHVITDADKMPSELGEANRAYAARALLGSKRGKPTKLILVVFAPAAKSADSEAAVAPLTTALSLLTGKGVDYMAPPADATEAELTVIKGFVQKYRKNNPTLQVVLPNVAADDRGVVNYTSTVHVGNATFTPAQYCSRIAGALAGIPTTASATYLTLDEVTSVDPLNVAGKTEEEAQDAAIGTGQLIVVHDGTSAWIARGVNSLTTLKSGENDALKKIKVTEGEGLLFYYTVKAIREGYLGNMVNTYDNRCLLVVELQGMYAKLEQQGLLLPGSSGVEIDVVAQRKYMEDCGVDCSEMDNEQIRQYEDLGDHVFIRAWGKFADTMENFDVRFNRMALAMAA